MLRNLPRIGAWAVLLLGGTSASAAEGFQLELFEPRPGGSGLLDVPTSRTLPELGWSLDVWASYVDEPLRLEPQIVGDQRSDTVAVADRLTLNLVGAFAPVDGIEISAALPAVSLLPRSGPT